MNDAELKTLLAGLADTVRAYVEERIAAIPPVEPGKPGKDAVLDVEAMAAAITKAVDERMEAVRESALATRREVERIAAEGAARLEARLEEIVSKIPVPKDGEPGRDFDPEMLRAEVAKAVAAIPPAKPGKDGESVSLDDCMPAIEAYFSKWAIEVERRANDRFEAKLAEFRQPKDGLDGLSIKDLTVTDDGDGNVTLKFCRDDVVREFVLRIPRVCDKGVYRDDAAYRKGDGTTANGSWWIAQVDEPRGRPGTPEADGQWRLAVKSGRNGRDAPGSAPAPSPVKLR